MGAALAEAVYAGVLRALPACAREWFNSLDRPLATAVEEYTKAVVSPGLLDANINAVQVRRPYRQHRVSVSIGIHRFPS
eukprot:952468-Prorocentrum_minimum.AAC.1